MTTARRLFTASFDNVTMLTDQGDFLSMEGVTGRFVTILELLIWGRATTTLALDTIVLRRGAGAAITGGTTLTNREVDVSGTSSTVVWRTLPTVDVATVDWEYRKHFNNLQENNLLPIPEMQIPLKPLDDLGIFMEGAVAHIVGGCITWAETGA